MFNTICWYLTAWGLGKVVALVRFILFWMLQAWLKTGVYENYEEIGYLGWKEAPVFGALAFIRPDGSLQFYW